MNNIPVYQNTKLDNDNCFINQKQVSNNHYSNYNLTNYRNPNDMTKVGMTRWAGYSAPPSIIELDSDLRHSISTEKFKTSNIRTDCYDYNGQRTTTCSIPFGLNTPPSGANGYQPQNNPQECTFTKQLPNNKNKSGCTPPFLRQTEISPHIHNPNYQIFNWERGGINTRHNLRLSEQMNKNGKSKKLKQCNTPYLG